MTDDGLMGPPGNVMVVLRETMVTGGGGGMAWQPIETAPRDGKDVLLHVPMFEDGPVTIGYYTGSAWACDGAFLPDGDAYAPTHWMPLPEGP